MAVEQFILTAITLPSYQGPIAILSHPTAHLQMPGFTHQRMLQSELVFSLHLHIRPKIGRAPKKKDYHPSFETLGTLNLTLEKADRIERLLSQPIVSTLIALMHDSRAASELTWHTCYRNGSVQSLQSSKRMKLLYASIHHSRPQISSQN